ncbi:hypothetical protein MAXJ12_24207 [Mesorhizobium alhagi CCNWXJ12-2]|uniref:Uncharacterized protein n=1 Tax=Mesorhizobium alhagi CCNWXJ12-2 TaxID=1107882 RepID=H0HXC2_9HYPH|nr:hypothetical protein MAXJ12_24207 [Mesorhizobium alhagi CCNWXJ12-2]
MYGDWKRNNNALACGNIAVALHAEAGCKGLDLDRIAKKSDTKMMRRESLLHENYIGIEATTDYARF